MVYEHVVEESRKNLLVPVPPSENQDSEQVKALWEAEAGDTADEDVGQAFGGTTGFGEAYGAYHVAAILCKKDYTLWVRAADSAAEIADLHSSVNDIQAYRRMWQLSINAKRKDGCQKRRVITKWQTISASRYRCSCKACATLIQLGNAKP
jgi:hypothetical protein